MKRILFVIYYEPVEYLLAIKENFEKYNFDMTIYPLYKYAYDSHSKLENYQEHLSTFIKDNAIDIILWWFIDVPLSVFEYVINSNENLYNIIYNSDDPYNLHKDLFAKCKLVDLIITPCNESKYLYNLFSNSSNVMFSPFGYDSKNVFPIDDNLHIGSIYEKYACDICIHTYDLYIDKIQYPDQYIYMLDLINNLISYATENNKKIKLYGTSIIKEFFPKYYSGDLSYIEINMAYNFSKIIITTHSSQKMSLLTNKQLFSMLGSGGIVFIDKVKDIEKIVEHQKNCIIMEKDNYIKQIDTILQNYEKYKYIKNNAVVLANNYNWDIWVKKIIKYYSIKKFDGDFYSKIYNLDQDPLKYWENIGCNNMDICYNFQVPDSFDHEQYAVDFLLEGKMKEYLFLHWKQNSKNSKYTIMKNESKKNSNFNPEKKGITMDQYHNICRLLNKIRNNQNRDKYLMKLGKISNKIYGLEINKIINNYLANIY